MKDIANFKLANGKTLELEVLTYPLSAEQQWTLLSLWWIGGLREGDYDFLKSMNGNYSDTLKIQSVIGMVDGVPTGTASVNYPVQDPEVAVVGMVTTHPDFRRLGIGAHLTNAVTDLAFAAGCKVAYLGAERIPNCLYLRCGYEWHNGGVMRRAAKCCDGYEEQIFASGQKVAIRPAAWGDMSGFTCLVVQPLDCWLLDYPRGYVSGRHVSLERCVSNFPNLYDQVVNRGGVMPMLIGDRAHRVLGFGSLTPGPAPARGHKAIIDVAAHDHFIDYLPKLLEELQKEARRLEVQTLQAFVAEKDQAKKELFSRAGFQPVAELRGELKIPGRKLDVTLLEGDTSDD